MRLIFVLVYYALFFKIVFFNSNILKINNNRKTAQDGKECCNICKQKKKCIDLYKIYLSFPHSSKFSGATSRYVRISLPEFPTNWGRFWKLQPPSEAYFDSKPNKHHEIPFSQSFSEKHVPYVLDLQYQIYKPRKCNRKSQYIFQTDLSPNMYFSMLLLSVRLSNFIGG